MKENGKEGRKEGKRLKINEFVMLTLLDISNKRKCSFICHYVLSVFCVCMCGRNGVETIVYKLQLRSYKQI